MAHTPGPWAFSPASASVRMAGKFNRLIVYGNPDNPKRFDDARLIAAAPDLLAFTKQYEAAMAAEWGEPANMPKRFAAAHECWKAARAAIAKAEGR